MLDVFPYPFEDSKLWFLSEKFPKFLIKTMVPVFPSKWRQVIAEGVHDYEVIKSELETWKRVDGEVPETHT